MAKAIWLIYAKRRIREDNMKEIGERIKNLRESRGMSLVEVARGLLVSVQTYKRWENGIFPKFGVEKLVSLAKFYGVNVDFLLGF